MEGGWTAMGMNVSLAAVWANLGLLFFLLAVKQVTKLAGVYPFARHYVPRDALYTTLLMSTGLTFGTISSMYGYRAGLIDQAQFSVLVMVVVLSAIVPTLIAQRFFSPERHLTLPPDHIPAAKPSDRAAARERATVGEEA